METKQFSYNDVNDVEVASNGDVPDLISIEQLRHLVRLLDRSDVSEVEVKRIEEGTHLVLRKAVASDEQALLSTQVVSQKTEEASTPPATENKFHTIVAPLVGIFHPWAKPRGKALVAVGDRVKVGQLVGSIQALNVIYEVEASVSGLVVEILVQDGQPVEYGQQLLLIDSSQES
jgi:acetyl-CoA carboxylase biotin carboxyl carrier protein